FRNLYLAGSVLRRDYDWTTLIAASRVKRVVNMVATADWVVAIFPSGMERFRQFDLGGAGFDGFINPPVDVEQIKYIAGSHGAGVAEKQWERIADFVVADQLPTSSVFPKARNPLWVGAYRISTLLLVAIVAVALTILTCILAPAFSDNAGKLEVA